jgi:tetratricopeptide (TPR) repeat protein
MPRPRRWRGARAVGCVVLAALVAGLPPASAQLRRAPATQPAVPKPRVLVFDWGPGAAAEAATQLRSLLEQKGRFRFSHRAEAIERLKSSPGAQRARADAAAFTDAGRAAEMSLQWGAAETAYRRALEALQEAVVRLHDPEIVARLHLALGAVAFHQGQRTEAHDEFRRGLSLWPALQPDRSYNPQVRAAFDVARGKVPPGKGQKPAPPVPPPPPPSAAEVGRVAAIAGVDAVIVVEEEVAVGRTLRASLYSAARRAFVAVETRALAGGAAEAADHEALAGRVAEALDGLFPPPKPPKPPKSQPATQPATQQLPPPPPPPPWYKRWWLWATIGAVVITTVTVPLLVLRRETVDLVFRP